MPEIRIGCSPVPPHRRSYFDRFSFGEISQTWMDPVRPQRLRSMRKLMKPDFELVVTAWRWLTQDPLDERGAAPLGLNKAHTGMLQVTDENRQIWALVAQQLRASRAHSVLLKTPNTFGPSKTNRTALTQFVKEIIQPGDLQVIWEPRGIWDYEDALEQAQESGVLLASDPFTDGAFPEQLADKAYYVLTGPHGQARFREDDLLRLIDFVDEHDEAVTLVVRGEGGEGRPLQEGGALSALSFCFSEVLSARRAGGGTERAASLAGGHCVRVVPIWVSLTTDSRASAGPAGGPV